MKEEQVADLVIVVLAISVMWYGIMRSKDERERTLDARMRVILLGTIREPGKPPMSFTGHWIMIQATATTNATRRDVARLLRALEQRKILRRLPAARKRSLKDRFELTPEAEAEMRKSVDQGSV